MTLDEMTQIILNHWKVHAKTAIKDWTPAELMEQARARAMLADAEMQSLAAVGVDRQTAWVDVRNSMALRAPA